jgi:hypothetical protein
MPQLLELAGPLMRRCTRFHTNEARRQIGKELKNSRSTNTPADHHRPTGIDADAAEWVPSTTSKAERPALSI